MSASAFGMYIGSRVSHLQITPDTSIAMSGCAKVSAGLALTAESQRILVLYHQGSNSLDVDFGQNLRLPSDIPEARATASLSSSLLKYPHPRFAVG